ncbi:MAG: ATP synthase F1 subunit gamma [Flammeovirgaceae bacterium]|jgi:F-type H+-transporting ATPase subunit gamma|nr:ATP synthase F1 subunit gamma [Flammeovirgaceae bacterium]|tara:strand:+ start:637 stop:1488 length:852 start_codon:yes stop_codon:yes gene_type:complete
MPSIKEVKNRIGSVKSTQQLTKAMKMVAAAKLKKAQDKVLQLRPYSKKLNEILSNLSDSINNELFKERNVNKVLVVIVSSDKGLCGGFNSSLIKEFKSFSNDNNFNNITVLPIGKKAYDFFKNSNFDLILDYWEELNEFSYEKSSEICDFIISSFIESRFDKVSIIYNEFKNVAVQKTVSENFLPVIQEETKQNDSNNNYIFEPQKNKIIDDLIPQTLKTQLLKSVLESNASEQGSRMTAMSQATDNAGELLKELKLTYNRSRQAAITKEILEIVGGAEALNN